MKLLAGPRQETDFKLKSPICSPTTYFHSISSTTTFPRSSVSWICTTSTSSRRKDQTTKFSSIHFFSRTSGICWDRSNGRVIRLTQSKKESSNKTRDNKSNMRKEPPSQISSSKLWTNCLIWSRTISWMWTKSIAWASAWTSSLRIWSSLLRIKSEWTWWKIWMLKSFRMIQVFLWVARTLFRLWSRSQTMTLWRNFKTRSEASRLRKNFSPCCKTGNFKGKIQRLESSKIWA